MSSFELGKPGYYTVQNVQENEFLNAKLESDQYGIYYSVKFEGDAETFLWQAKTAPVAGEKYYGHIEQSKSGKSLRFKKDKLEEDKASQAGSTQSTDESIARAVALKAAVEYSVANKLTDSEVTGVADIFLAWLKDDKTLQQKQDIKNVFGKPTIPQTDEDGHVNFDESGAPVPSFEDDLGNRDQY